MMIRTNVFASLVVKCAFICVVSLLISSGFAYAQNDGETWSRDVNMMLSEFLSCKTPIDDRSPCNVFLARALKRVYNITDFDSLGGTQDYLGANQIADKVAIDPNWTLLGTADNQETLNEAQGYANLKKAIIAVYKAPGHGHVCLILPGKQQSSVSWDGAQVPNSASFPLDAPKDAYVGGPLSKAFGPDKRSQVKLYGRNF